jgi:hypothetical protein
MFSHGLKELRTELCTLFAISVHHARSIEDRHFFRHRCSLMFGHSSLLMMNRQSLMPEVTMARAPDTGEGVTNAQRFTFTVRM